MRALVFGATGATGRAAVDALIEHGHEVTAFARRAHRVQARLPRLRVFEGDVMDAATVARAVEGHDAVLVTLGIRENPLRVRFGGSRHTPMNVRSEGTRHVVEAMRAKGVRKLVVQSSYGVGDTRNRLTLQWKLIFSLLLKPQIADTELQEQVVRDSGLDWVLARPVGLAAVDDGSVPFISTDGEARRMSITHSHVARFLVDALESPAYIGRAVALSSQRRAPASSPPSEDRGVEPYGSTLADRAS